MNIFKKIENEVITIADEVASFLPTGHKIINALNIIKTDVLTIVENPLFGAMFSALFPAMAPEFQSVINWIGLNQNKVNAALNLGLELTDATQTLQERAAAIIKVLPTDQQARGSALMTIAKMISEDITKGSISGTDAEVILQQIYNII